MKNHLLIALAMFFCSLASYAQTAPGNDACGSATTLNVNVACTNTAGRLYAATASDAGNAPGCGSQRDVFYRFTVPASAKQVSVSVGLTSSPSTLTTTNTFIEIFNGNTCPVTNKQAFACQNISARRTYDLAPGNYTMRIYTSLTNTTTAGSNAYNFNVCVSLNDFCETAVPLTIGTSQDGSTLGATTSSVPQGCATTSPDDEVWYKFTAAANFYTISLSNLGANLSSAGARLQLYSGTCGALTSLGCGNNTLYATGLTPGTTYYCRVYSQNAGQTGTAWGFRILVNPTQPTVVTGGRMKEVFSQRILSAPSALADPWEVTYGPDNHLWITESKGYRVVRVNTQTGVKDTVLDISLNSTFLPLADRSFNTLLTNVNGPQGGLAGLALHPNFLATVDEKNYVYIAYIHSNTSSSVFTNRIVRFNYNKITKRLESPISICDTLPGSNDHNSQRMIIAPVGDKHYLFYASGDMGAGQFVNKLRPMRAQIPGSVEGKILRFNLEPDGDLDAYDKWIPSGATVNETNPYSASLGKQSPVWSIGIRNNQGFAYDTVTKKLYGSSHGPYSDDELNVIERGRNYGHPLVIGYAADGNVNGTSAGGAMYDGNTSYRHPSSIEKIDDEVLAAAMIGPTYKDPVFSAYANSPSFPSIRVNIWEANPLPGNGNWPSEGWSGLDIYNNKIIPGWKQSVIASSLKWGRLVRIKLDPTGEGPFFNLIKKDTTSYFGSTNRFRDLAFAPNGKDIYVVMDRNTTSSGPSQANPVVPGCPGCLQRYTFLGYQDVGGLSTIPIEIPVAEGVQNTCNTSTTITIDDMNKNYWVPITGPDGNIVAEIFPNGEVLGTVTASFYKNGNAVRVANGASYGDRNITITPQNQPSAAVKIRLYMSIKEYEDLDANALSGITTISDVRIHKNTDPCQSTITAPTTIINPSFAEKRSDTSYMFQADISGFSTFYFASANLVLPINSLTFTGSFKNAVSYLKWETKNEINTDHFELERSVTGTDFQKIRDITATGSPDSKRRYTYNDQNVLSLGVARLFYRLKVVDTDGAYTYSKVVVVDLPNSMITNIAIFPNPADKQTTALVTSSKEQTIKWQLVDVSGRVMISKDYVLRKGENRIIIDLAALRVGTYFFQISGQSINVREKIQKL